MKTEKGFKEIDDGNERKNKNLWKLRRACMNNAIDLFNEANFLFENDYYSRSFTLAFTAFEELGKFLIVSDFITGITSKKELQEAFRDHNIKTAYMSSSVKIDTKKDILEPNISTLTYDKGKAKKIFHIRQAATYVNYKDDYEPKEPSFEVTDILARQMIQKVKKEIEFIHYAEDFNGRIGSQAIFK